MNKRSQVTLLGSTGSIGTQTLDIIDYLPDRFEVRCRKFNCQNDFHPKMAKRQVLIPVICSFSPVR